MSKSITLASIPTQEDRLKIHEDLSIDINKKPIASDKPWKKRSNFFIPKNIVQAYKVDKKNRLLRVPFAYPHTAAAVPLRDTFPLIPNDQRVLAPSISLRPYQEEIVKEAISILKRQGSAILALYTGAGKSLVASYIANHLIGMRTLIVFHRLILMDQWKSNLQKYFPNLEVGTLMPNKDANSEAAVSLVNAQNISKIDPQVLSTYGTVIVDECFPGETQVLVRDAQSGQEMPMTMEMLVQEPRDKYQVLSYDHTLKMFEYRNIIQSWKKKTSERMMTLLLSNGNYIRATENHRFLLRDGSNYKRLKDLNPKKDKLFATYALHANISLRADFLLAMKLMGKCVSDHNTSTLLVEFVDNLEVSSVMTYLISLEALVLKKNAILEQQREENESQRNNLSYWFSHMFDSCLKRERENGLRKHVLVSEFPAHRMSESVIAAWLVESSYLFYPEQMKLFEDDDWYDISTTSPNAFGGTGGNVLSSHCFHPGGRCPIPIRLYSHIDLVKKMDNKITLAIDYIRTELGVGEVHVFTNYIEISDVSDVRKMVRGLKIYLPSNHKLMANPVDIVDVQTDFSFRPEETFVYDLSIEKNSNYVIYTGSCNQRYPVLDISNSWHTQHIVAHNCHLIMAKTLMDNLLYLSPRFLLGLSATPYRPDGLDKLFEWFFGKNDEASSYVRREMYREHTVYVTQTNFKPTRKETANGTRDWNHVLMEQSKDEARNELIVGIVKDAVIKDGRFVLILVKRIEHADTFYKMLKEADITVSRVYGKYAEDEETQVTIGTVSKAGTGFDRPHLDTLVIAADVEEYFTQYLGRVFRREDVRPIIYDFKDKDGTLNSHLQTRINTYKRYGGILF